MKRQASILIIVLFLSALGIALPLSSPRAQNCEITFEEIITLKDPVFNTPLIWSATYGEDGMDQFSDLAPMEDGGMVAGGSFTKGEEDNIYHPLLVRLDARGRTLWESREETKTHKTIHRLVKTNTGFTVVGDLKKGGRDGFYMQHFSEDGKPGRMKEIFEPDVNLNANSLVQASDGAGFIIGATRVSKRDDTDTAGIIYKLTKNGGVVWRRQYSPGQNTAFNNIQGLMDGSYAVSGNIEVQKGRTAAWFIKIDNNGAIMWQRSYPRGSFSSFHEINSFPNGEYILTGQTRPHGGGRRSAWVMKTDVTGTPLWQRYYVGDYHYIAHDVLTYDDGRSVILLDGDPLDPNERAHVRFLTLSPRGYLMNSENFTEGENANAAHMILGPDEQRLAAGNAQTSFSVSDDPSMLEPSVFDGWAISATALERYNDPCLPQLLP